MRPTFHIPLLALAAPVAASPPYKPMVCISSLIQPYSHLPFAGPTGYYPSLCLNRLKLVSLYVCARHYCGVDDLAPMTAWIDEQCTKWARLELALSAEEVEAEGWLEEERVARMRLVGREEDVSGEVLESPVLIDPAWFEVAYQTANAWEESMWARSTYSLALYAFWGIILLVGMADRFLMYLHHSHRIPTNTDAEGYSTFGSNKPTSISAKLCSPLLKLRTWVRTQLGVPSAYKGYHQTSLYGCTVPTNLEFFFITAYWTLSAVLCGLHYYVLSEHLYWPLPWQQLWRYIADRTGVLSYANLPLLWLFGGRNNIFIWATGWSFATFNVFHRHIARIATLQAIAHSVGYIILYFRYSDPRGFWMALVKPWFYMGVVATILMTLICFFSFMWFRRYTYEFFLLVHIIFSAITIFGLFCHTSIFRGEYDHWLWPLVVIWLFDRIVRLVRMVHCNVHLILPRSSVHKPATTMTYDTAKNIIEINMTLPASHLTPKPGQYYFIYEPFRWRFYENHPFTLASWSYSSPPIASLSEPEADEMEPLNGSRSSSPRSSISSQSASYPVSTNLTLTFLLRARTGWTSHLKKLCLRSPSGTTSPTLLLEGPYGHTRPLLNYGRIVMIAGGAGIATMAPYLLEHTARYPMSRPSSRSKIPRTQRRSSILDPHERPRFSTDDSGKPMLGSVESSIDIDLVWASRDEELIRSFAATTLTSALGRPDVQMDLYTTGKLDQAAAVKGPESDALGTEPFTPRASEEGAHLLSDEDEECEPSSSSAPPPLPTPRNPKAADLLITRGRPALEEIIERSAAAARAEGRSLAVVVCGPAGMADAARKATGRVMKMGGDVEYFEEAFGW